MARSELEKMGRARFGAAYDAVSEAEVADALDVLRAAGWTAVMDRADDGHMHVVAACDPTATTTRAAHALMPIDRDALAAVFDKVREAGRQEGRAEVEGTAHDDELEDVARLYRANIHGRPTRAVQMRFGYSRRTAARRVRQARDAGLLPETTAGKKQA